MRCWLTTIVVVMARSLMYSVSISVCYHVLFSISPNSVYVVVFFCSHEHVFCDVSSKFLTWQTSKSHPTTLHPICNLRARIWYFRFFHFRALISCFFVARWKWCLFLSIFHDYDFLFGNIAANDCCYRLIFCFCCLPSCCSNHRFRSPSLFLWSLLLPLLSLYSPSKLRKLNGHRQRFEKVEPTSSSSFRIFAFTHFNFSVTAVTSHANWKVAVSVFELSSAAAFTFIFCRFCGFFVFQCRCDHS